MTEAAPPPIGAKPAWLHIPLSHGPHFKGLKRLVREQQLHTICEEAACPNIGECWGDFRTASFLLLGDTCTRNCGFCDVTTGRPGAVDWTEPRRLAEAVARLNLRHVVITSVTRDDLDDGGAAIFAMAIRALKQRDPGLGVEVLIPDFQGNWEALSTVMSAAPDILNHNLETVPRLYSRVRPKAVYSQSLELLRRGKALSRRTPTKSGLMLGLGETRSELLNVMADLRANDVDVLTLGQYMRPSLRHLPVERYVPPSEFDELKEIARSMGFKHVESGPLVRSSYHAHAQVQ
ncbi:MAG: lipoyl synthase [Chloroflexi bacterium]|nr:lipoyl synthase [Chloroflexota bacterium]MBV9894801.1 lipoyl synthase [Chloroflexota bacterium]